MNKKELLIPFIFLGLTIAFIVISILVYLSKGKSAKWVARKMAIGGLLLTLSCSPSTNNQIELQATCYDRAAPSYNNEIEISIDSNKIIYGNVVRGRGDYSYAIANKKGVIIQKDTIFLRSWINNSEDFVVEIKLKLDTGKYQFRLFNCKLKEQDSIKFIRKYEFNIKHE